MGIWTNFHRLNSQLSSDSFTSGEISVFEDVKSWQSLTYLKMAVSEPSSRKYVLVVNKVTIDEPVPPYTLLPTIWKLNRLISHTTRNLCTIIILEYVQWTMVTTRKKSKLGGIKSTKAERAKHHTQIIIHFE